MKTTYHHEPVPHIIHDDVFDSKEISLAWKEWDKIYPHLAPPEKTGSARTNDGKTYVKQNSGAYLESIYGKGNTKSSFMYENLRLRCSNVDDVMPEGFAKDLYYTSNFGTGLFSVYEDGDYYKPHRDRTTFTLLYWMWHEPKEFSGGEFWFPHYDYEIEVINNRAVLFPGCTRHEVKPIVGKGRHTVSMFFDNRPVWML